MFAYVHFAKYEPESIGARHEPVLALEGRDFPRADEGQSPNSSNRKVDLSLWILTMANTQSKNLDSRVRLKDVLRCKGRISPERF